MAARGCGRTLLSTHRSVPTEIQEKLSALITAIVQDMCTHIKKFPVNVLGVPHVILWKLLGQGNFLEG